jgi:hypothetical protein
MRAASSPPAAVRRPMSVTPGAVDRDLGGPLARERDLSGNHGTMSPRPFVPKVALFQIPQATYNDESLRLSPSVHAEVVVVDPLYGAAVVSRAEREALAEHLQREPLHETDIGDVRSQPKIRQACGAQQRQGG